MTHYDVLSALEEEETSKTAIVYIEPNDSGITHEDSAYDDDGGLVDNLSGNQLNAVAETVLPDGRHINNCCEGSETVSNKGLQTPRWVRDVCDHQQMNFFQNLTICYTETYQQ